MSKIRAFFVLLVGINIGLDTIMLLFGLTKYWPWFVFDVVLVILLFTLKSPKYEGNKNRRCNIRT